MNPFLKNKDKPKSKVARREESKDLEHQRRIRNAEQTKKKAKSKKSVSAKEPDDVESDLALDVYEEDLEPIQVTKNKKKRTPKEAESPELSTTKDDWGLVPIGKPVSISKIPSKKKLRSIMADNREEILQMIEVDNLEGASGAIYKKMLQSLVDVIGHAESMIHRTKGQRGTHQLNLLISNLRDVMLDIQQAQDRGRLGETLAERHLGPAFLDVGLDYLRLNEQLFNKLKREVDEPTGELFKTWFNEQEERYGQLLQEHYRKARDDIRKFLQR